MSSASFRFATALLLLGGCSPAAAVSGASDAGTEPGIVPDGSVDPLSDGGLEGGSLAGDPCDPYSPRVTPLDLLIGPDGLEARIVAELDAAQKSIDILIYDIDRPKILTSLANAKARGVALRIVYDRTREYSKSSLEGKGLGDVSHASPEAFVYSHSKVVVIDGERAIVMSANLSKYSMVGERNYGVIDRDPADVAQLTALVSRDFAGAAEPDLACSKLVVSPVSSRPRILALLARAKMRVDVAAMYVTDAEVRNAIIERKKAGLAVRVLLANPAWIDTNVETAQLFLGAGIEVRYFKKLDLHAKLIVVDPNENGAAFVGSVNFSTNSLNNNREVGVMATDAAVLAGISEKFESDWKSGSKP